MDKEMIRTAVEMLLKGIGEDPEREGLKETPDRIARMYEEILGGAGETAAQPLSKTFHTDSAEIVLEKDIVFYSMCEHHMMPFFGKAHVAYIPDGEVVGLSKLARTVEIYARRLQLQERLTAQISDALMAHVKCRGVIVMLEAEHMCMTMRGVRKPGSQTVTIAKRGAFADRQELERTFFAMLGRA